MEEAKEIDTENIEKAITTPPESAVKATVEKPEETTSMVPL
jgi:hypothetical protein